MAAVVQAKLRQSLRRSVFHAPKTTTQKIAQTLLGGKAVPGRLSLTVGVGPSSRSATSTDVIWSKLVERLGDIDSLWALWDEDGNGTIDEREFLQALRLMGMRPKHRDFARIAAACGEDGQRFIELEPLKKVLAEYRQLEREARAAEEREATQAKGCLRFWAGRALHFLNRTSVQLVLYLSFVTVFGLLTEAIRSTDEYLLSRFFEETFFDPVFMAPNDRFRDVRRIEDIYTWGNTVLWPGLLGNAGPNCGAAESHGVFESARSTAGNRSVYTVGECNDDAWPDGDVGGDGTPYSVSELASRMNQADWTGGVRITQSRVQVGEGTVCGTGAFLDECLPEFDRPFAEQSKEPFGWNWTAASAPLDNPFLWHSAAEMGSNPSGQASAAAESLRIIPSGGFVSFVIPFFSSVMLPEERSPHVADFRLTQATVQNGRPPNFFCVRLSWNGEHLHQLCDPNLPHGTPAGRTTGVVRRAILEFWNDLKRAHYLDPATRSVYITMSFSSHNAGTRLRINFMFELAATGAVLPSFDINTLVDRPDFLVNARLLGWVAFMFCLGFLALEGAEVVDDGPAAYFSNMWNAMDWSNFLIFFYAFSKLLHFFAVYDVPNCPELCQHVGYIDDWEPMLTMGDAKTWFAICVCIQLLKLIKFFSSLVPKMGLAPAVLKRALADLTFFGLVFVISMYAFSACFYILLGPYMTGYATQAASFMSLARALFGDFDIDEIMDNSSGYMNAVLFVSYLFVAVFILLSMFFAILGEAQVNIHEDERIARQKALTAGEPVPREYGAISEAWDVLRARAGFLGFMKSADGEESNANAGSGVPEPSPIDRMEARQLSQSDVLLDLAEGLKLCFETLGVSESTSKRLVRTRQAHNINAVDLVTLQYIIKLQAVIRGRNVRRKAASKLAQGAADDLPEVLSGRGALGCCNGKCPNAALARQQAEQMAALEQRLSAAIAAAVHEATAKQAGQLAVMEQRLNAAIGMKRSRSQGKGLRRDYAGDTEKPGKAFARRCSSSATTPTLAESPASPLTLAESPASPASPVRLAETAACHSAGPAPAAGNGKAEEAFTA